MADSSAANGSAAGGAVADGCVAGSSAVGSRAAAGSVTDGSAKDGNVEGGVVAAGSTACGVAAGVEGNSAAAAEVEAEEMTVGSLGAVGVAAAASYGHPGPCAAHKRLKHQKNRNM